MYRDGDIVWVKLSNCWWPGEVQEDDRLPADMVNAFKKKRPIAIVKFFQEDSYEYVKNVNNIHNYQCDRRLDFIRKGLDLYKANNKYMEMFPADVATAERRTGGDPDIVNNPAVLNPAKQMSSSKRWAEVVSSSEQQNNKKIAVGGKNKSGTGVSSVTSSTTPSKVTPNSRTALPSPMIAASGGFNRPNKEHEVRILSSATTPSPALSNSSQSQQYKCQLCNFSSGRMNLLILHSKSHTNTATGSPAGAAAAADPDHRRLSLSSAIPATNKCTMTPSKRFSTASSSTSSPALSPVSAVSSASVPSRDIVSRQKTPPPPPVNKSRPPKKRTKRVPSPTEDPAVEIVAPQPVEIEPTIPAVRKLSTVATSSTRRSRNRRRSSTPPTPAPPSPTPPLIMSQQQTKDEESPAKSSPLAIEATPNKNVALEASLLQDWSEDDDEQVAEEQGKIGGEDTTPNKKITNEEKDKNLTAEKSAGDLKSPRSTDNSSSSCSTTTTTANIAGRSSPIRCRNIPKKDRREIILDEFEPKISPNRTEVEVVKVAVAETVEMGGGMSTEDGSMTTVIAKESDEAPMEEEPELPIVQKKKKAVIERLSQQSQEGESVPNSAPVSVSPPPPVKTVELVKDEQTEVISSDRKPPTNEAEQNNNQQKPAATVDVSCFEFDEDSPPASVAIKRTAEDEKEGKEIVSPEEAKIKLEIEKKDQELLAQIGNILDSTTELADKLPVTTMDINPAEDPLTVKSLQISLPPKERGKRIFKSRNTSTIAKNEEHPGPVAIKVEEEEKQQQDVAVKVAEEEKVKHEIEKLLSESPEKDNKQDEGLRDVKEDNEMKVDTPPVDSKIVQVPRKRRFIAEQPTNEESNPISIAATDDSEISSKKARRISSPDPIEAALKQVCEDVEPEPMEIEEKVIEKPLEEKKEEAVEVPKAPVPVENQSQDEEEEMAAAKPKIKKSHSSLRNNGDKSPPLTPTSLVESSPIKTNDLLASKSVQKVQIVQRVRTQDGSETTETKVAKISSADSANALSVAAITQPPMASPVVVDGDPAVPIVCSTEPLEICTSAVNGSAQLSQESPLTPTIPADANASPTEANGADPQILAIPAETFGGPANSFYLCTVDDGNFIPIDNQPLYLDASNQLVPTPQTNESPLVVLEGDEDEMVETEELIEEDEDGDAAMTQILIGPEEQAVDLSDTEQKYILTTGNGQQILLDLQSLLTIASGGEAPRLVLPDGQEMVIEGTPQEILSSITISPASNSDLDYDDQSSSHDIIGGPLDTSVVYPTVSTAHVSETNAVLTQPPIMSTLETPYKATAVVPESSGKDANLEESLAVIGVKKETSKMIPASLELPITITNPKIAAKTTQASIKSVYMTTTAVCGSKVEPMELASEYAWTTTAGEGSESVVVEEEEGEEAEANGHVVMVVEEEGDEEFSSQDEGESRIMMVETTTGVILAETSE